MEVYKVTYSDGEHTYFWGIYSTVEKGKARCDRHWNEQDQTRFKSARGWYHDWDEPSEHLNYIHDENGKWVRTYSVMPITVDQEWEDNGGRPIP